MGRPLTEDEKAWVDLEMQHLIAQKIRYYLRRDEGLLPRPEVMQRITIGAAFEAILRLPANIVEKHG